MKRECEKNPLKITSVVPCGPDLTAEFVVPPGPKHIPQELEQDSMTRSEIRLSTMESYTTRDRPQVYCGTLSSLSAFGLQGIAIVMLNL